MNVFSIMDTIRFNILIIWSTLGMCRYLWWGGWSSYKFALLSQEFAFDIPHPSYFFLSKILKTRSKFALQWSQQWKTNHVEMKVVYDQFLLELTQKYEQRTVITTCDKKSTLKTVLVHEKIPSTTKLNVRSNVQNEKQKQLERASRRKRNIRYLKKVQPSVSNLYKTT